MSQKLRIGILMNSYKLPLWQYILIERLINSNYASINLVVVNENKKTEKTLLIKIKDKWKSFAFSLYTKLDQRVFNVQPNAFESKNVINLLDGVPKIKVKPISKKFSDRLLNEDILKIKHHNLDILIRFGFGILKGGILKSAKYGIWSYHHGDNNVNRGAPAGFWEVMENWDVTGSILQILTEELDAGTVLYRSFSQTDKRSVHRNKNILYWKSLSFLPRKLEELYNIGDVAFFRNINELNKYPIFYSNRLFSLKNFSNWKMSKLIMIHFLKFIKDKFVDWGYIDQSVLLFDIRTRLSTSFWRFKKIIPPKNRFFANPFIIQKECAYYIFIAELICKTNKGHISVIKMDEKGNYEKPVKVIDKSYHLSYPFIFKSKDDYFLIPESRSNKTIELYKCVEFPYKWEFQMNLMENIEALNATLFYYQNKWWLFCNIIENSGASSLDELFLFYSEELQTKNWIPHPLNPIVSDVRKSKPAGNIFIHDGKIIRPSQNNSKRYGCRIKLNEIRILNENKYEEIEIETIEPNWDKQIMAIHTLNNVENLTVIDGIMRRMRYF